MAKSTIKNARKKLDQARKALNAQFPERVNEIDSALAALLVRENIFMGGPPGTAKSRMAEAICRMIGDTKDGDYFKYQFHPQSVASEVVGGRDFDKGKDGRVVFNTWHRLPECQVALLDEIFKAHSVLQVLLRVLEEHEFDNGDPNALKIPMRLAIGASNELPTESDLEALFDRFMCRHWVGYCKDPQNVKAIMAGKVGGDVNITFTGTELDMLETGARGVTIEDDILDLLLDIKETLARDLGVIVSDRRWFKIVKMLRAYSFVDGQDSVDEEIIAEKMADLLWREVKDRPAIDKKVKEKANPLAAEAQEILDGAKDIMSQVPDSTDSAQFLAALSSATGELTKMIDKLKDLDPKGKNRIVKNSKDEVKKMLDDAKRQGAKAFKVNL